MNEADKKSLEALIKGNGWALVKKEIEEKIKSIDEAFYGHFENCDLNTIVSVLEGNTQVDKVIWLNRYQRAILQGFLDIPEELLNSNVIVTKTDI